MTMTSETRICIRCDRPIMGQAEADYRHRDGDPECRPRTRIDP